MTDENTSAMSIGELKRDFQLLQKQNLTTVEQILEKGDTIKALLKYVNS